MSETKWHRICAGLYKIGDVTVDRQWYRGYQCDMWHVIVDGRFVEMHAYLRDAKAAAITLVKARGEKVVSR